MKKLLCFILSLAMILSTIALVVTAATPRVNIEGISGASYNASSKTITLKNASATDNYINIVGEDVTINLIGTSTITSSSFGIVSTGSIEFTGDGSLTVTISGNTKPALVIEGGNKTLDFNGTGTITFNASAASAIEVDGTINFNKGTVVATAPSNYPAVLAYGVTRYDNLADKAIDDEIGSYNITKGSDMEYVPSSLAVKDVKGTLSDEYVLDLDDKYVDGSVTTDDYYIYKKVKQDIDSTDAYIYKYDKYTNELVDAYPADNATGASWSTSYKYYLKTLATSDVTLNTDNGVWTYTNAVNSVTVKPKTADEKIASNVYNCKNVGSTSCVCGVQPFTKPATFKTNLVNENAKLFVFKSNGSIEATGDLGTGYIVKLKVNGSFVDQRTIVVLGDTNGDATINVSDVKKVLNHSINKNKLEGIYFEAGNVNSSDNVINVSDVKKVLNVSIGKYKSF